MSRLQQERSQGSDSDSKIESMEEDKKIIFATPVHYPTSSVFMTPPLSDPRSDQGNKTVDMQLEQQDRGSMEEIKKISFDTPVHVTTSRSLTPPLSDRPEKTADVRSKKLTLVNNLILPVTPISLKKSKTEERDMVTSLYLEGFPLIVEKIFSYLSPADVLNCLTVCSRWKLLCTNLKFIKSKLPVKAGELQEEKENQVAKRTSKKRIERCPLTSHNPNIPSSSQKTNPLSIPRFKRAKCPNCSSVAKQYNFDYAECYFCAHSFCPNCLSKAHTDNTSYCKNITQSSPTKEEFGIGTKQVKKRLKRL